MSTFSKQIESLDSSSLTNLFFFSHDFKLVFGVDIQTTLTKADRLLYGESLMTHAMAFTGVSVDVSLKTQ